MTVALQKANYLYLNASRPHLSDPSCRATESATHIFLKTSLDSCWTIRLETGTWLTFYNKVKGDSERIGNITRDHNFGMNFNCSYRRKEFLSLSFTPQGVVRPPLKDGFGNLTFTLNLYKSDSFGVPYKSNEYPVDVVLNNYIYLRYSVETVQNLVVMAVNCRATKTGDFYSSPYYNLITDGCSQDTSMEYLYDPNKSFQTLKVRVFRFLGDYDPVYLHCELLACYANASSRCSQGCRSDTSLTRRRKREVTTSKENFRPTTTQSYKINQGPIQIIDKKGELKDTGNTGKQAAIIFGASAAGGVGLLLIIGGVAFVVVKFRLVRLLMKKPNQVRDLYATQDEPTS